MRAGRIATVQDFPGGIHPPEHKDRSNGTPIQAGPLPAQLVIPLNMHLGTPARPRVRVGDTVLKGERIAEPAGAVSTALHAPTSGTVVALGPRPVAHPSGMDALCIVLEPDGEDRWTRLTPMPDYHRLDPAGLAEHLRLAGVAGLGGAGFPTAVKVSLGDHQRVEQLVINAAECEPYITADDRLMRERAVEIVTGIQILQYLLNPHDTLIGVEDNKPEAIDALRNACGDSDIEVRVVPTRYPSGGEKQLIQRLTGKEVPSGGIPAECGVVCQNVGTAWAIKRAVIDGEPLISRITTVTGDAVARPGNYEVLIGTLTADLLRHAGVDGHRVGRLVIGGPMMGFTLHDPGVPLVKTSNCVIAATQEELPEPPPEQACIRCGACADVCPASLLPQQLYWHAKSEDFERARQHNLIDCIECGACAYVCPSHIPLVQYYRFAKGEIRTRAAEQIKADRARERFEARQVRLEQAQAEKEARRRARLEANRRKAPPETAAPAPSPSSTASSSPEEAARRQKRLKALKTAYNMAHKQYKEAHAALERAQREGRDESAVTTMAAQVEKLKAKTDRSRDALDQLVEDAKADLLAHTGKDLKTLKLDAARAEARARDKAEELRLHRDTAEADTLETLNSELKVLEQDAQVTRLALKKAVEQQGLADQGREE